MTGQRYLNPRNEQGSFNGGSTQQALSKFFILADEELADALNLNDDLVSLMYEYKKNPRSNVQFYLPNSFRIPTR
ncbi:MAG: hypothetical protein A2Z28_04260 [Chloroflexi bacterium RBG_16_51_9]|nr:MAG: hypothetical protein A2Z28_04260 [Chloroflexi bacterium RBG_16_51_9]